MNKRRGVAGALVGSVVVLGGLLSVITREGSEPPQPAASALRGFMGAGGQDASYAPGRLLVQVRESAMTPALAGVPAQKGRLAAKAKTGVPGLDALAPVAGITGVSRPYDVGVAASKAADGEEAAGGVDRWFMVALEDGKDAAALVDAFAALPEVEAVSLDWRAWPASLPTDPGMAANWGHANTAQLPSFNWDVTHAHTGPGTGLAGFDADVTAAWALPQGLGAADVVIAIIDSGVDADHPGLRQVAGYDFGEDDADPDDDSAEAGHGTCCAGIAAALADGQGAVGVAPGCAIMPLKVADGDGIMWFSAVQAALYHAADNGADVASLSFGAPIAADPATEAALRYAHEAGVLLVAATGNGNRSQLLYPASSPYVVAVGAAAPGGERKRSSSLAGEVGQGVSPDPRGCTDDGERWWGSSYGSAQADAADAVDLLGPSILPTCDIAGAGGYRPGDDEPFFNGTSCATPYVAGVAALVISAHPDYTPARVREVLVGGARDVIGVESGEGWDRYSGHGLVNAQAAVLGTSYAGLPGDEPAPPGDEPQDGDAAVTAGALQQNQPNPFNPVTSVAFTLPRAGAVRLTVYSLRGQVVARLVEGELAAGEHEVTWDASGQPSGLYVCRLQAAGIDETRKMSLVK